MGNRKEKWIYMNDYTILDNLAAERKKNKSCFTWRLKKKKNLNIENVTPKPKPPSLLLHLANEGGL